MERLIIIILSLSLYSAAYAKDFRLTGVIKEQIASPELTVDEKTHKYMGLVLDKPIPMNVYSEDTESLKLYRSVSVIQLGWKGDFKKIKNKKVNILAKNCINSLNAHIYTDVMCETSEIKIVK